MSHCKLTNFLAYKWPPILSTSHNILNSKPCSNDYRINPPLCSYMCLLPAVSTNSVQTCSSGLISSFMYVTIIAAVKTTVSLTSNCRYIRQTAKYVLKCTVFLVNAIKAHRGSRRKVPLILNVGDSWWRVGKFHPPAALPQKGTPVPTEQEPVWMFCREKFLTSYRDPNADRPAGSVVAVPTTLHRLPCEILCYFNNIMSDIFL